MKRWTPRILKWTGFGLLGLLVLVVLLAGFVVGTTPGGRLALGVVMPRLPVEVSVDRLQGRLAGRFQLLGAHVAVDGIDVAVDTLEVRWRPGALAHRHLAVDRVFAGGVVVNLTPAQAPPDTTLAPPDTAAAITLDLPLRISLGALRAHRITVTAPGARVDDGVVTASGSPEAYAATVAARVSGEGVPAASVYVAADGDLSSARLEQLDIRTLDGAVSAQGTGEWLPRVAWDLDVQVRDVDPGPVIGDSTAWNGRLSALLSTRGTINEAGPAAFVAIDSLDGDLRGYHVFGAGRLDVTQTGARIESFELGWGPLDVRVAGEASWSPQAEWAVDFSADSLYSALFLPDSSDVAGVVHLRGHTAGSFTDVLRASARIDTIDGEINGRLVRGRADVSLEDKTLTVSTLDLAAGINGLSVSGVLSEAHVDVRVKAAMEDPSAVLPGAHGRLAADVTAVGPPRRPEFQAVVSADTLEYREYAVRRVRANAGVDLSSDGEISAEVRVDGLVAAGGYIDSVRVSARGGAGAHDLSATVHADSFVSLALEVAGGLLEDTWKGNLHRLDIAEPHAGEWSLRDTVAVSAGDSAASLSPLCLVRSDGARICVEGYWNAADSSRCHLEIHEFPLAAADTLLAGGHLRGVLNAILDARVSRSGDILADGALRFDGVALEPLDSTLSTIDFDSVQVSLRVDGDGAAAELRLLVKEGGRIRSDVTGSMSLDGYNNVRLDPMLLPLHARIDAHLASMAFLGAVSHMVDDVRGEFRVSGQADGTLSEPELTADLRLEKASAVFPDLGIHVRDISLDASARSGEGLRMEGQARSGRGTVKIITESRMSGAGSAEARVQLRGEHFRVVNTPEATVDVSPDLELDLKERRIDLTGDMVVPFARIEILQLPENAVQPSQDVVFVDEEKESRAPVKVAADVRLALGDSVRFRGFGAVGRFEGSIRVAERPGRPTAATGELRFRDAEYTFLGQLLTIDPGRIFFAGGTLDNPGLDIRAFREFDVGRVKAGVQVRGTAKKPITTVFSIPAMSQANALSYLLTGRGIEDASGTQSDMMMATAVTMGLQQGNSLTTGMGSSLGLDDARFEAGETVEETSFVAGKYLSPTLYVSYGIGVFDRIGTWKMRYSLTRKLTVQTETGRESGADLFYKFERGDPPTRAQKDDPDASSAKEAGEAE